MSRSLIGGSAVALAISVAVGGWTLTRALELEPSPRAASAVNEGRTARLTSRAGDARDLAAAVEHDPFRKERRRPSVRYRVPGDAQPSVETAVLRAAPGALTLIGTVISAGGRSFAMCQLRAEPPRVVRVGDTIGAYTLRRVEQGGAYFVSDAGERLEIRVPQAGSDR